MRTIRNRRLSAAIAGTSAALVIGAVGVGPSIASATRTPRAHRVAKAGGVIRFAESPTASPNYIFPIATVQYQSGYNIDQFDNLLYPPLYSPSPDAPTFDYSHSIAKAPIWSAHDTTVTLQLKPYRWSDGAPVTARDVIFSINLARAEGASYGNYAGPTQFPANLKSYTALGERTLRLVLDAPVNPTYYEDDGLAYLIPIPQHAWDKTSANGKVGNYDLTPAGAKKVLSFLQGEAAKTSMYSTNPLWKVVDGAWLLRSFGGASSPDVFVPNPHYSGAKPRVAEFEEIPFTSDSAEFTSLKSGTGTLSYGTVPVQDIPAAASLKPSGFNVKAVPVWGFSFIIPNTKNPQVGAVLSQGYVRQVLARLTDQKTMIQHFMDGYGVPSYGVVPVAAAHNPFLSKQEQHNPYPYSVHAAVALLKAHGWKVHPGGVDVCERGGASGCGAGIARGQRLALNLLIAGGSTIRAEEAALLQSDAAKAGVQVSLRTEDFNTVIANVAPCMLPKDKGTPQCDWQLGEFGYLGQSTFPALEGVLTTGGSFNAGQYSNAKLDALVAKSTSASSLSDFFAAEDLIATQEPWIWQPMTDSIDATAANLAGYGLTSEFDGAAGFIEPQYWYFKH